MLAAARIGLFYVQISVLVAILLSSEDEKCPINIEESFGRGGGDRTHDLRLKRPLLYH